ncbi:hypothetical protein [Rummeliibacillus pycnus]|uniref:hypothetical protein n=1 Tax=Rummeliibacillus pycnus TaxID=101070 RepID=UPI003D2DFCF9
MKNIDEIMEEINKLKPDMRGILLNRISIEYFGIDRRSKEEKLREEKFLKGSL